MIYATRPITLLKSHDQIGRLIVYLFLVLTLYFYSVKISELFRSDSLLSDFTVSILILGVGLFSWIVVRQSDYPLEFYGVTLKNGWKHAKEGFLWTLPVLAVMLVVKWILVTFVSSFKELGLVGGFTQSGWMISIFDASKIRGEENLHWIMLGVYIALVPIQEFLARGFLQGCLYNFFTSSNRALLSILSSNLLFGLFHGFKTVSFSLAAFLLGLFWGWIYYKQKSLVGSSISHALVGFWAFGVLNYQNILIF